MRGMDDRSFEQKAEKELVPLLSQEKEEEFFDLSLVTQLLIAGVEEYAKMGPTVLEHYHTVEKEFSQMVDEKLPSLNKLALYIAERFEFALRKKGVTEDFLRG